VDRRTKYVLIAVILAAAPPVLAQYLGPVGSPLPIQRQSIPTTGIVRNYGSMPATTPFPTGSFGASSMRPPTPQFRSRTLTPVDNSLGSRVASYAKWQGVTRGIRF